MIALLTGCDGETLEQVAKPLPLPSVVNVTVEPSPPPGPTWQRLRSDGIHDPEAPGLAFLQEPAEALSLLPPDIVGNQVRWVHAINQGAIEPRTRLYPETKIQRRNTAVYLDIGGRAGIVRFPHREHLLWLDCANCHDELFSMQPGETLISMARILEGEKCGRCHGAVAFPLTECIRCHSVAQPRLGELLKRPECHRGVADKLVVICDE